MYSKITDFVHAKSLGFIQKVGFDKIILNAVFGTTEIMKSWSRLEGAKSIT